jgi:hypothetical protein
LIWEKSNKKMPMIRRASAPNHFQTTMMRGKSSVQNLMRWNCGRTVPNARDRLTPGVSASPEKKTDDGAMMLPLSQL